MQSLPFTDCRSHTKMIILFLSGEVPDNEEKPKGTDAAHVGQGSADCLALHKKGLYVAGQVCHDQTTSSLSGVDPGFFLGGGAPLRIGVTDC